MRVPDHRPQDLVRRLVQRRSAIGSRDTEMGLKMESPELCLQVIGVLRDRGVESR